MMSDYMCSGIPALEPKRPESNAQAHAHAQARAGKHLATYGRTLCVHVPHARAYEYITYLRMSWNAFPTIPISISISIYTYMYT